MNKKTFRVQVNLDIKMVLDDTDLEYLHDQLSNAGLNEHFKKYLGLLNDPEKRQCALIREHVKQWFKSQLASDGTITFAPPHVVVEGKAD